MMPKLEEVEFGNAHLGPLLCPTTSFASLLCELGRQRARENVLRERPPVYSGMMSYEIESSPSISAVMMKYINHKAS
ncbi:MAG: hypothetical protein JW943_12875 [Deltaproteobacteria bacterium]|nr:hypothetical protein [Deltaproteobacteria bacterium]